MGEEAPAADTARFTMKNLFSVLWFPTVSRISPGLIRQLFQSLLASKSPRIDTLLTPLALCILVSVIEFEAIIR